MTTVFPLLLVFGLCKIYGEASKYKPIPTFTIKKAIIFPIPSILIDGSFIIQLKFLSM